MKRFQPRPGQMDTVSTGSSFGEDGAGLGLIGGSAVARERTPKFGSDQNRE